MIAKVRTRTPEKTSTRLNVRRRWAFTPSSKSMSWFVTWLQTW